MAQVAELFYERMLDAGGGWIAQLCCGLRITLSRALPDWILALRADAGFYRDFCFYFGSARDSTASAEITLVLSIVEANAIIWV